MIPKKLLPISAPAGKWIPVEEALPIENTVVIAQGPKGTWEVGMFRGIFGDNIYWWNWKKNSIKDVKWWMYKDRALPTPEGL